MTDNTIATPIHWIVGHNMPGYSPDNAPDHVETWNDAVGVLCEDLERASSDLDTSIEEHDCDNTPCPTYGDSCAWTQSQECADAVDQLTDADPGYPLEVYAAGEVWFIVPCNDPDCTGPDY